VYGMLQSNQQDDSSEKPRESTTLVFVRPIIYQAGVASI